MVRFFSNGTDRLQSIPGLDSARSKGLPPACANRRCLYLAISDINKRRIDVRPACLIECGEERFLVEWNHDDDSVFYDLFAFSKPQHPLAKLGFPFTRLGQKQFIKDSKAAMQAAVSSGKYK